MEEIWWMREMAPYYWMAEHAAVTRFREYLRIATVHPDPEYGMDGRQRAGLGIQLIQCDWREITIISRGAAHLFPF